MGQQQSKDELLYQKAIDGDIDAVKALSSDGAGLEWIDKEGKTPLIAACMNSDRYILARTLIERGANVNAYRPGRHAGTPLHHAAKRGLDQTVRLLLSHGANLFVRNDNNQTPLDVARFRGFTNVARLIESRIWFFSGWLREFYGPGFLELLAPQLLSRKIWAVVIPCAPHNPSKPLKLELAIYSTSQDAQPRAIVALWKADIDEPKLNHQDPSLTIFDKPTRTRYKFAACNDGDKQQIQSFYLACRGIPQVAHTPLLDDTQSSAPIDSTETAEQAAELAMEINASLQSVIENRPPRHPNNSTQTSKPYHLNGWDSSTNYTTHNGWGSASDSSPETSSSDWISEATKEQHNGWGLPKKKLNNNNTEVNYNGWRLPLSESTDNNTNIIPSAPPIPIEGLDDGPIQYPSIDFSPIDILVPSLGNEKVGTKSEVKNEDDISSCVICWEAPVEGACVPCGHMAGCMACLDEIKIKKGDCPVCRTKITQVIRIYAV